MPRKWRNPHGFKVEPVEFRIIPRQPLGDWAARARCAGEPPDLWFDEDRTDEAIEQCFQCPVRLECLHHGIKNREPFGVWGGVAQSQRTRRFHREFHQDGRLPIFCNWCGRPFIQQTDEITCRVSCARKVARHGSD